MNSERLGFLHRQAVRQAEEGFYELFEVTEIGNGLLKEPAYAQLFASFVKDIFEALLEEEKKRTKEKKSCSLTKAIADEIRADEKL
jgi:hypothetical protein